MGATPPALTAPEAVCFISTLELGSSRLGTTGLPNSDISRFGQENAPGSAACVNRTLSEPGRLACPGNILETCDTGWILNFLPDKRHVRVPEWCFCSQRSALASRQDGREQSVTKQARTVIDTLGRTRLKSRLVTLEFEDATRELFVCFDGEPVARRGNLKTGQSGTWISLQPGVVVRDLASDEGEGLEIEEAISGTALH